MKYGRAPPPPRGWAQGFPKVFAKRAAGHETLVQWRSRTDWPKTSARWTSAQRESGQEAGYRGGVMASIGHSLQQIGELAWRAFQAVNTRVPATEGAARPWAPGPLLKSHERTRPPLGFPRETDSLCPRCVMETRGQILRGERNVSDLVNGHLGEIKATFYEEDNQIRVRKTLRRARHLRGPASRSTRSSRGASRAASRGATSRPSATSSLHRHGTSTHQVRPGGGARPSTSPIAAT